MARRVEDADAAEAERALKSADARTVGDSDEASCVLLTPSGEAAEVLLSPSLVTLSISLHRTSDDSDNSEQPLVRPGAHVRARLGRGELPRPLEDCVQSMAVGDLAAVRGGPASLMQHDAPALSELQHHYHLSSVIALLRLEDAQPARDLYGDASAVKHRIARGHGEAPRDFPVKDCPVLCKVVDISSKNDPALVLEQELDAHTAQWYELGVGMLSEAVEAALRVMVPYERSDVCDANLGLRWLLELVTFEKVPDLRICSGEEAIVESQRSRSKAAEAFRAGHARAVAEKLSRLSNNLDAQEHAAESADIAEAVSAERARVYASEAAARAHLGDDHTAADCAQKALKEDNSNAKAMYQLSCARARMGDSEGAEEVAESMEDSDAKQRALSFVKRLRQRGRMQEKQAFGGMFVRANDTAKA